MFLLLITISIVLGGLLIYVTALVKVHRLRTGTLAWTLVRTAPLSWWHHPIAAYLLGSFSLGFRYLTRDYRCLPDFYILGSQKCGTTALASYLQQHPCILSPYSGVCRKETQFWTGKTLGPEQAVATPEGISLYRLFFPLNLTKWFCSTILHRPRMLSFDGTPAYLFLTFLPRRLAVATPEARMIVLLREPISRLVSQFSFNQHRGGDRFKAMDQFQNIESMLTLELDQENIALWAGLDNLDLDEPIPRYTESSQSTAALVYNASLRRRGQYAEQLSLWFKYFPRDRFLIVNSSLFSSNPAAVLSQVLDFLELPQHPFRPLTTAEQNITSTAKKSSVVLSPESQASLEEHFAPHNAALVRLLGSQFAW